jgi:glycosyltransferase involved in cell wall biosynthesis
LRIFHLIDSLIASGGAENGLVRESVALAERHEQRVMILYDIDELKPQLEQAAIDVISLRLPPGSGSRSWPKALQPVRREIAAFHPDVVQTSLFLGNLVGQVATRGMGIPVVSNLVLSGDRELLRRYQPGADTFRATLLRGIAGLAARRRRIYFRALTEEVRETNAELLGVSPNRIRVIPRGVPSVSNAQPRSRESLGLPSGRLVMNVGRLASQKNQVDLVRAFQTIESEVPGSHLVIVGRDWDAADAVRAEIDRLGLAASVSLPGQRPDVSDLLAHADVFAFTSLMEGLGTSVLEAMAAGVPVVAYDIPTIREATLDGAYARLVPSGDIAMLASEVISELTTPTDLGDRARRWVAEERSIAAAATAIERLFVDVVEGWDGGDRPPAQ